MNDAVKAVVLERIGAGLRWAREGQTSFRFPQAIVHARFKSSPPFSFNINPATLRASFELWICGNADLYYLIPIAVIRRIYEHPDAYTDSRHPEIRVVSIDTHSDLATYARGGQTVDIGKYKGAALPTAAV